MSSDRLSLLINKYLSNTASPEEEQELSAWYQASNQQEVYWPVQDEQEAEALKARLLNKLQQAIHPAATIKRMPFYRSTGLQVAAAVLIILGAASWFLFNHAKQPVATTAPTVEKQHIIVPGGNKAVLTLADGSKIVLDSAQNTTLASQGNTKIIKLNNGQLAYRGAGNTNTETATLYNTISTPKGGQYEIILPDGSHVWLNAASSLRFPTAFADSQRRVELSGEAYFEVTKNPHQPFAVHFKTPLAENDQEGVVEVLGTHFNVNAYTDEAVAKTTLLEGKVRVSTVQPQSVNPAAEILLPGQQAAIAAAAAIKIQKVDAEESIAWKNGIFNFNKADIKTVMRQIARWYNVEVVYEGAVSAEKFEGEIPRSSTLTEVFKILELSAVHFKIEGRKVIVMP
jgi:transmembrane sensor